MKIVTDGIKGVANLMEYFLSCGIRTKNANTLKNVGRIIDNMNKQILIDYNEYLELVNSKKQYEDNLKILKEKNNYDFLLEFKAKYEALFKHKDIQAREYGSSDWKSLNLPMNDLYEIANDRIEKRIKENILGE